MGTRAPCLPGCAREDRAVYGGPTGRPDESVGRPVAGRPHPGRRVSARSPSRRDYLRTLGPGLVAGAADVDPTTVATMAVIGSTTGFALSWLAILVLPVLVFVQVISSRVAVNGGADLQTLVRRRYGRTPRLLLLGSVLGVGIVTLAADTEAGAAGLGLLVGLPYQALVAPLAVIVVVVLLVGSFDAIQRILTYIMLSLLAYPVAAFLAHTDWLGVWAATVHPAVRFDRTYVAGALALLGTTLTNYVYVWQTVELAESRPALSWLRPKEADAAAGIVTAVGVSWFILVATGATLGVRHQPAQTPQQAAQALAPIAGPAASTLFAVGLLGSALLAMPVLMGTIAYVLGAEFDWRRGLSRPVRGAPAFYLTVAVTTMLAALIAIAGVSPIELLFFGSVIGGLSTPIGLSYLVLLASDRRAMRGRPLGAGLRVVGWLVTALVSLASVVYLAVQL